jgi:intracellular sulfur oxidation DsrE/DsrF family protein
MTNLPANTNYLQRPSEQGVTFSQCFDIPIKLIKVNHKSNQTRKQTINPTHLKNIKTHLTSNRLESPIVVVSNGNGVYIVESGHHRFESFKQLQRKTIPGYIATFNSPDDQEEFRQRENAHKPVLPHSMEDAERYLVRLQAQGAFANLDAKEKKQYALNRLARHFHHFSGQKRGKIYKNFLENTNQVQYKTYTSEDRAEYAKKFGYVGVDPGEYDFDNKCYYVNSSTTNAEKNIATINAFKKIPQSKPDVETHVFVTVNGKTLKGIEAKQKEFVNRMTIANKDRLKIKVGKIFFPPQIVGLNKDTSYTWDSDNNKFDLDT